ncbi:MAG: hypothetical protein APR63_12260 [Desulfuromonas sp. SDB]|nr:MAG: hypothetical protein APR63_12260 [Desulfuromonas sp. SDB]
MNIAVASGKGGTGKTFLATNLAKVISQQQKIPVCYLDGDVEEPNGHIFLKPDFKFEQSVSIPVPQVDDQKCTYCGKCSEVCQFNAIIVAKQKVLVFPELCHGCGSCSYFCPSQAIAEKPRVIGKIQQGYSGKLNCYQGELNLGEPMPVPVINDLTGKMDKNNINIFDCPPGTSCSLIAALSKSDYVILVTESTPFGLHDLKLSVEVVKKLALPCSVVVNRTSGNTDLIDNYCNQENLNILAKINDDRKISQIYARGELVIDYPEYSKIFHNIVEKINLEG